MRSQKEYVTRITQKICIKVYMRTYMYMFVSYLINELHLTCNTFAGEIRHKQAILISTTSGTQQYPRVT